MPKLLFRAHELMNEWTHLANLDATDQSILRYTINILNNVL